MLLNFRNGALWALYGTDMKTNLRLYSYKMASKGCKALQRELQRRGNRCLRITHENTYKPRRKKHVIINWGISEIPQWNQALTVQRLLNHHDAIRKAANKLTCFTTLHEGGVSVPEFTTSLEVAKGWVKDGEHVFARTILNGHSGRGIVSSELGDLPKAPLYVKYIKKQDEFRIHVFNGEVIDVQQKKRNTDIPDDKINWQIRNHANGFIFAREGVQAPDAVIDNAIRALDVIGLDFGAIDIIWNDKQKQAFVLEINTAPGLEGTTLEKYAEAIEKTYGEYVA